MWCKRLGVSLDSLNHLNHLRRHGIFFGPFVAVSAPFWTRPCMIHNPGWSHSSSFLITFNLEDLGMFVLLCFAVCRVPCVSRA